MSNREADIVFERFDKHEKESIFYRPQINWSDAFIRSLELSKNHTKKIGSHTFHIDRSNPPLASLVNHCDRSGYQATAIFF
jgi:hypothetical protein